MLINSISTLYVKLHNYINIYVHMYLQFEFIYCRVSNLVNVFLAHYENNFITVPVRLKSTVLFLSLKV